MMDRNLEFMEKSPDSNPLNLRCHCATPGRETTPSPQRGRKSSFLTALICITSRQIPASVSTNQGTETDDLVPLTCRRSELLYKTTRCSPAFKDHRFLYHSTLGWRVRAGETLATVVRSSMRPSPPPGFSPLLLRWTLDSYHKSPDSGERQQKIRN